MKDELGKKMVTKFVGLSAKTYSYLINDCSEDKKKGTKKCIIKRKHFRQKLKIKNKNCLEAMRLEIK